MGGKKWPCEWSSTILEVLMEDCYFLRTSALNWVHLRRNIRNVFVSFGSFITKSWLSRVKVKARKYNNGGSVVPHVLFSSALPFSLATDSGDQASVLQSQNALLRLSKDVSSGLHWSTQRSTQENWWSFAKIKTKQNKKYFGRILWKYIKLQVDNRHDLFLKKMDGDRHFRLALVFHLPFRILSWDGLKKCSVAFLCGKRKIVQNSETKLTDGDNKSNKDLVASKN